MNIFGRRIINTSIVLCLPFLSIRTLSVVSKLKVESVLKLKVVSANADTILVANNKRGNTNINEGN